MLKFCMLVNNALPFTLQTLEAVSTPVEDKNLSNNPLLKKNSLPLFGQIKADHILPAVEYDLSNLKTNFQSEL